MVSVATVTAPMPWSFSTFPAETVTVLSSASTSVVPRRDRHRPGARDAPGRDDERVRRRAQRVVVCRRRGHRRRRHRHRGVRDRRVRQPRRHRRYPAVLRNRRRVQRQRHPRRVVVVGGGHGHVHVVEAVVVAVAAARRVEAHLPHHVAVVDVVVHPGHRHRLRRLPVLRREHQRRRRNPPLGRIRVPGSRLVTVTVTAAEGCVCNATVNVAVPPPSVTGPLTALSFRPNSSSRMTSVADDGAATPRPPAAGRRHRHLLAPRSHRCCSPR